jgi:CRISPR type III-associated protein (TIGR04423 family)
MYNREELQSRYDALDGSYEGYIQMSGKRIEYLFRRADSLPKWGDLHKDEYSFIFEAALYDPKEKCSVLVRQMNDGWIWNEYRVDWDQAEQADRQLHYSVFEGHSSRDLRMLQLWEEREDPLCPGFTVQELDAVVFAGFEKGGEK